MDFGDILKQWEQGHGKNSSKDNSAKTNMETWLNENEIYDKDAEIEKENIQKQQRESRRRLLTMPPDDILDIHFLTSENAYLALDQFFDNAKSSGYKKLRIIHGKGNHSQGEAILKSTVRKFIEQCSYAGESGFEKSVNGGSGATWVLLK
ncbi:MAG: Smr/MutS family protein [Treponema sp.]|nr:Smr/MutS family protein [Treponema sp.]MCL2251648.1 Smr/MutS family protein [Treponema sp.]